MQVRFQMPSPNGVAVAEHEPVSGQVSPESSPFWPLLLALAEIAARVERRQAEEHAVSNDEAA